MHGMDDNVVSYVFEKLEKYMEEVGWSPYRRKS